MIRAISGKWVLLLCIIALIPFWQWLNPRIPLTHDLNLQIARIASFTQGIRQGSWFPRWGGNLNRGYGHPAPMFLYPLVSYLGAALALAGLSYAWATKLVFALTALLAAVGMYLFQSRLFPPKASPDTSQDKLTGRHLGGHAATIGTLLYLLAPYRLVDINVRGALGELMGLAVLPWVFWRFHELRQKPGGRNLAWAGSSVFFLILAHNAVGLMGLGMLVFWMTVIFANYANIEMRINSKKQKIIHTILALGLGAGLASFYLVPGLIEGKYTFQKDFTDFKTFASRYPQPLELIYSPWGYGATPENGRPAGFTVAIGWAQWLGVLLLLVSLMRGKLKLSTLARRTAVGFLVIFAGGVFLLTPFSIPLVRPIGLLHRFQFPWRFLIVTTTAASVAAGALVAGLKGSKARVVVWLLVGLAVFEASRGLMIQGYDELDPADETFEGPVAWTTDTGESTPRWGVRFQDYWPEAEAQLVSGEVEIVAVEKTFTRHRIIAQATEPSQVVDNTLYFPGWTVVVNGEKVPVEYQDQNWRGLITFPVPAGRSEAVVEFRDTRVRKVGNLISVISLVALGGMVIIDKRTKKQKSKYTKNTVRQINKYSKNTDRQIGK